MRRGSKYFEQIILSIAWDGIIGEATVKPVGYLSAVNTTIKTLSSTDVDGLAKAKSQSVFTLLLVVIGYIQRNERPCVK